MVIDSKNTIIFTDLDGTLLDYKDYSYSRVTPLVQKLKNHGVIVVFCSSKTRAEQEIYRSRLGLNSPFISENGGAIYIGKDYFPFSYEYHRLDRGYQIIELGKPYGEIKHRLDEIRQRDGLSFKGFGDMDIDEVVEITGLDQASARLAKKREYSETLNLVGSDKDIRFILKQIEIAGLEWIKGTRFYSVSSGSDKGRAARVLLKLFKHEFGEVRTIGIGDSLNDFPMLAEVEIPVLVQKPGGYWEDIILPNLHKAKGVGPEGWVDAIGKLTGF
ncbi:MAG: mannosyl-3-phosphoglycerate phosphatase [Dehalococcoidia bacterium]|nr:MAG: mannosyl-3-phosphoglycerate phosphatase [Dehalococcoidia bacterium]